MQNTPPSNDPVPEFSSAALLEWEAHAEAVLRGVAHALNNRAASVAAVMDLCIEPDYTPEATRSLLTVEVQRLHDLVNVVRAVGVPRGGVEAFEPTDATHTAGLVIGLHAALRDRSVQISAAGAPPIRTWRWLFIRALVVLVGRSANVDKKAALSLECAPHGDWLDVSVSGPAPDGRSTYLDEAAAAMGGEQLKGRAAFRLPTLATLRRREGR